MFAAAASLVTLGGCSKEELAPQQAQESPADDAEVITTPMEIRLGTPGLNFATRAAFDNENSEETEFDLGVFCLARAPQNINKQAQPIRWWSTEVDPLFGSTFCLLDNVESTRTSTGMIEWKDGEHRYYPFTQFYSYDFYAYYPYVGYDSEDNTIVSQEDQTGNNTVAVTYSNLDGKTDILWGRATSSELYAYSAKYFRQPANKGVIPSVQLDHMLTRLIFKVVPGVTVENELPADYTHASQMIVTGLKVKDVVKKATLLLADYNRDNANTVGSFNPNWIGTDEPDRLVADYEELQTLNLCGENGEPFEEVQVSNDPNEARQLGESLLLYPEHEYVLSISLRNVDGTYFQQDHPLTLEYPRNIPGDNVFKAGCQYVITIEVHGPKEINIKAQLTPWQDELTPEEQDDVNLEL